MLIKTINAFKGLDFSSPAANRFSNSPVKYANLKNFPSQIGQTRRGESLKYFFFRSSHLFSYRSPIL